MKITDILNEKTVRVNLPGTTKEEILNAMIELGAQSSHVDDTEKMRTAIFEREKIMSTGVGSGFPIPPRKTDAVKDIVAAFAVTEQAIDYQSLDDQPVRLVFLLVGRDTMVGPHIKLLSRISRLMNKENFRHKLLQAKDVPTVLQLFRDEEAAYSES